MAEWGFMDAQAFCENGMSFFILFFMNINYGFYIQKFFTIKLFFILFLWPS